MEAEGAVLPAIERARANDSLVGLLGDPTSSTGAAERQLMQACSRTLFSVWAKRPGADGQIPYDDFGEVTLSAISAECFPGVKFPSNSNDAQAARDFLLLIGLTHPILRDMRDVKAFTSEGMVFLLLHGSIGFKVPNDELSRRLSVAMAITKRQGYLLTWFFAAPHDSELQQLLAERVKFDPAPLTKDASAPKAGSWQGPAAGNAQAAAQVRAPPKARPRNRLRAPVRERAQACPVVAQPSTAIRLRQLRGLSAAAKRLFQHLRSPRVQRCFVRAKKWKASKETGHPFRSISGN